MIERIAIIGAGSGGKASAVDLTPQRKKDHLFEFPDYAQNIQEINNTRTMTAGIRRHVMQGYAQQCYPPFPSFMHYKE